MNSKLTFISAGAGSGKTYRLTEILYEHLASGSVRPAGVIATTFTRKAAAELRERARGHLLKNGKLALAASLDEAQIGTVNGVCQTLLQRFCFEVGLSPDLRVIEEDEAASVFRRCVDDVLDAQTVLRMNALAARFGSEDWRDELGRITSKARSNATDADGLRSMATVNADDLLMLLGKPKATNPDGAVCKLIDSVLQKLQLAAQGSTKKNTRECIETIERIRRELGNGTYTWKDWVGLSEAAPEVSLKAIVAPLQEMASDYLSHPLLHAELREYIERHFSIAADVLHRYAQRKKELGVVDFTDQEILLLHALDSPEVADALREGLDLLLVDEFQDTSPVQLALFMKLTALAKETYWVGDTKQAIYGFRGSDADLMDAVIAALPLLGGKTEILGKSWRSRPALVNLVNQVFVPAFAPVPAEQIQLKAQRKELLADTAIEAWMLEGKNINLRLTALTQQVRTLLESGRQVVDKDSNAPRAIRPGDIAILSRSNDRVGDVLSKLLEAGVPFAAGHSGLLTRPECLLGLACLRRLNDPADTLATAEIIALGDCAEPEQWLSDRLDYLATAAQPNQWKETEENRHPTIAAIAELRTQLGLLSPREATELVVTRCDLAAKVLRWCRSEAEARQRLANLDELINLAAAYEDRCRSSGDPGTIAGLLLRLEQLKADELDPQPVIAADAVSVMTHHAAKGLEWPVVILLDLESNIRDRYWGVSAETPKKLDVTDPLCGRFIRFRPWPFGQKVKVPLRDLAASSAAGIAARESAVSEDRRLLYVSMTRARDLMILALGKMDWNDENWLGVSGASWLMDSLQDGKPLLPAEKRIPSLARACKVADAESGKKAALTELNWFSAQPTTRQPLPLYVSPSSAEPRPCTVSAPISVGPVVPFATGFDPADVGTAIHAVMAAGLGPNGPLTADETSDLLRRNGVGGCVDPERLRDFAVAMRDWVANTWPNAKVQAELPVRVAAADAQIVRGQIDLFVMTNDEHTIIDYKSGLRDFSAASEVVRAYAGQLTAYAEAASTLEPKRASRHFLVSVASGQAAEVDCTPFNGEARS